MPNKDDITITIVPNPDIHQYPVVRQNLWAKNKSDDLKRLLQLGDQHDNFLKIAYTFAETGLIEGVNNDSNLEDVYSQLAYIEKEHIVLLAALKEVNEKLGDKKKTLSEENKEIWNIRLGNLKTLITTNLNDFKKTVELLNFSEDKSLFISFKGDAATRDRGANQFFTQYFLSAAGFDYEVLEGDHEVQEFIDILEPDRRNSMPAVVGEGDQRSYNNLLLLKKYGLIDEKEVALVENEHKKHAKLFSYAAQYNEKEEIIGLGMGTHAIAGTDCLKAILSKYPKIFKDIDYKADTYLELIETIDKVNGIYQKLLESPEGKKELARILIQENHDLEKFPEARQGLAEGMTITAMETAPFLCLFWNYGNAEEHGWAIVEGIQPIGINGHIGQADKTKRQTLEKHNRIVLDNDCGKYSENIISKELWNNFWDKLDNGWKLDACIQPMYQESVIRKTTNVPENHYITSYSAVSCSVIAEKRLHSSLQKLDTLLSSLGKENVNAEMLSVLKAIKGKAKNLNQRGFKSNAAKLADFGVTCAEAINIYLNVVRQNSNQESTSKKTLANANNILYGKIQEAYQTVKPAVKNFRAEDQRWFSEMWASLCNVLSKFRLVKTKSKQLVEEARDAFKGLNAEGLFGHQKSDGTKTSLNITGKQAAKVTIINKI